MKSIDDILKMAQNVQAELEKAQANLDTIEVEGAAGGGLVKVRASAKGRIIGVAIDDSLLHTSEKQILEDLVAAAFNDARAKADAGEASQRLAAELQQLDTLRSQLEQVKSAHAADRAPRASRRAPRRSCRGRRRRW